MALTRQSVALTVVLAVVAGTGTGSPASAAAALVTTLYVNNTQGANCSDMGTGTQAQPFCTIQAGVNAASAGQTVLITPNTYKEAVDITKSGSASDPITIAGDDRLGPVMVGNGSYAFHVTGASDIVISGMEMGGAFSGPAVVIDDSHDVTFKDSNLNRDLGAYEPGMQVHVTGGSTNVDIADNTISATETSAIVIDGGGSNDTVTTNLVELSAGAGISVDSATGTTIVSNTVYDTCGTGIALSGTATGATIEDNVVAQIEPPVTSLNCPAPATQPVGVQVDAGAVSGTTENYNDVDTGSASIPNYAWSGISYATAAALNAATGQAATDSNTQTLSSSYNDEPLEKSPAVDSADASVAGEQSTDVFGYARVDDPLVANSGKGSVTYYDRGAVELQDHIAVTQHVQIAAPDGEQVSQAPVGGILTFSARATSGWGGTIAYTYDFGDGTSSPTNSTGSATHAYSTAGSYEPIVNLTSSYGGQWNDAASVDIVSGTPHPVINVAPAGDVSVSVNAAGSTDPWGINQVEYTFGDGSFTFTTSPEQAVDHTYAKAGTYTITVILLDAGQDQAQASATFTTNGSDFTAYGPTRVLDTRKGTGTGGVVGPVGANTSIDVQIGGTGTIPADATAVALNVTETDAASGGYITAYPTGGTRPATSNLNYSQGQTKAANVIVGLGSGGKIALTNTSAGSVSLIADVTGYFTKTAASGYQPVVPTRVLDTRKGTGLSGGRPAKVTAGGTIAVDIGESGASAVVLNLTATNTVGGGYITAYPDGTAKPLASSLNYSAGQTIANTVIVPVGADGKVDFYNGNSAPVDLVADVEGYFSAGASDVFVAEGPARLLDTRKSSPLPAGGTISLEPSSVESGLPATPAAYVYNVTVTQPAAGGYLTVYPAAQSRPTASNVNFAAGETTSNTAIAASSTINEFGANAFYNGSGGTTQLVVDLFGYFTGS